MAGELPPAPPNIGKPTSPKAFNCPACGATLTLRALGQSIAVACRSCGSVVDASDENYRVLSKAAQQLNIVPLIPLGTRGKLRGVLWEVIGFMQRRDGNYRWVEYLLFNPTRGFRWLMEMDGHWNYVVTTKEKPATSNDFKKRAYAKYMGKNYYLFNQGKAEVTYVLGEFYWRVKVGETVRMDDYVAPPEMLSCEISDDETIWSISEYVAADEIRSAFQIERTMPLVKGIAPNQPSPMASSFPSIAKYWGIFLAIIFVIQLIAMGSAANSVAYRGEFSSSGRGVQVSPSFELKQGITNVDFELHAEINNNWLELQADLINDKTGEARSFEQGIEYYSGYDSDGSWSEGSRTSHKLLYEVPGGIYHFSVEPAGAIVPFSITVRRDVVPWSNFAWALILISAFPVVLLLRGRSFEKSRWSNSDFSPYQDEDEDDS